MGDQFSGRVSSNHEWGTADLPTEGSGTSVVLASIDTFRGDDTADVRLRNVGTEEMELRLEEERSVNDETDHVFEDVGFFGTTTGSITDRSGETIGEAGTVATAQADTDEWHTVDLDERYDDPVVFTQVMSYQGHDPCHTRVRNVQSDSFEFQIEEWGYLDGGHVDEEVGYVVIDCGVHRLAGDVPLEVGRTSTGHAWREIDFTAAVGSDPVVVSRCQTRNGGDEVVTRTRRVTASGADVRLQEEEARGGWHTNESVGYLVMPQHLAPCTAEHVAATHQWANVNFSGLQPSESVAVASIDTFNGTDTAGTRLRNVGRSGMAVCVEEEASKDSEMNHAEEAIGFFKTRTGPLFDASGERIGEAGVIETDQPGADQWHSVALDERYDDPVVFMQVMSYEGGNPCHVRVQDVGTDSFEFQIEEWDYLDGRHDQEHIGYLVLESGRHDLAGGCPVEVGTTRSDASWSTIGYDDRVGSNPVVVSRCQSYNGHNEVVTRHRNVGADSAEIRLQEEQARDNEHSTETIGFMVAPRSTADLTSGTVTATDEWTDVGISGVPTSDPVFVTSIQTFDGPDTVGVRLRNVGATDLELFLEEETSSDDETAHTVEDVGVFATSPGQIQNAAGSTIGEADVVAVDQPAADHWHTVSLDASYSDPVVFAQVMSYAGGDPCHTRVRNVGSGSFEFTIEEWGHLDGQHTTERIGYVVVEDGVHDIEGEIPIEAGTTQTNHSFSDVSFSGGFRCDPVLLTHCQTHNGGDEIVTRTKAVKTGSAKVRVQEAEGENGQHTDETVGYLVVPKLLLGNRRAMNEFRPSCHGFAFNNYFDEMPDLPNLPGNLDSRLEDIDPEYGLCGGMALAARDFYLNDRPIPSENNTPQSGPLFDYLWERLLDTFERGSGWGNLRKFANFYLPTTSTRARSVREFRSLTNALDTGIPAVLGLVYYRAGAGPIWENHQVLAYDYSESGGTTYINVYDPNEPGCNNVEVRVDLEDQAWTNPAPTDKLIDAELYKGSDQLHNVVGLIHMDIPSQNPPSHL